jgi:L-asparaginase/Glu-tRNA(Gln) amidotransferase subunit D
MICRRALVWVLLTVLCFEPSLAQETAKPRVVILTTGGTIASRIGATMTEGPALVQAVPELLDYAAVEVEEFRRIGSSQMTPSHWLRLSRRIGELLT